MTEATKATDAGRGNFLSEGWRELMRKMERSRLRGAMRELDAERAVALTALGQRAWDEKVDLSAFAELRDRLAGLDAQAGALSQTAGNLEKEKASLEARGAPAREIHCAAQVGRGEEERRRQGAARCTGLEVGLRAGDQAGGVAASGDRRQVHDPGPRHRLPRCRCRAGPGDEARRRAGGSAKLAAENGELAVKLAKARRTCRVMRPRKAASPAKARSTPRRSRRSMPSRRRPSGTSTRTSAACARRCRARRSKRTRCRRTAPGTSAASGTPRTSESA